MITNYLIASPHKEWADALSVQLSNLGLSYDRAFNGKEAQALLHKNNYSITLLDLELKNHSSLEILRYIKLSKLKTVVMFYVPYAGILNEYGMTLGILKRLGIMEVLLPTMTPLAIIKKLRHWSDPNVWRHIPFDPLKREEKEKSLSDDEFTKVNIQEALELGIAAFDHYLRLAPDKYVRVVHQGEPFPVSTIQNYINAGVEYLYFYTSDRLEYINLMNELVRKMIDASPHSDDLIIKSLKSVADKYINEAYTEGIKPSLIEEGKSFCNNVYSLITKDKDLHKKLHDMEYMIPDLFSHSFLVSFYSILISKQIKWVGKKTLESIAIGGLLHDIGLMELPEELRKDSPHHLDNDQKIEWEKHPLLGAKVLQGSPFVNEQVRQIVYQHHEYIDGSGYPNSLTALKIYPLAKIVAVGDGYVNKMTELKVSPRETFKAFLLDRTNILKYEPNHLRALAQSLI
ncbi:MAG: HD domain-containing protein [Bacteriovoracaceae bacterium]|nr:HD domain-containing protein [Bacteriovoracaceae bacterium]